MDMNLNRLWEIVKGRAVWCASVHGVAESDMTEWLNNNNIEIEFLGRPGGLRLIKGQITKENSTCKADIESNTVQNQDIIAQEIEYISVMLQLEHSII